ncbi:MAG: hypothetical protein M1114_03970 [Candidatus Dependentiae bacterium]|nr:hypothetical protein [Candidatus Dependentiae bacterium]
MAQIMNEKNSVAWFKLAELVARREKERALDIYRLLSHSLPNPAYAAKLEAEVLAVFNDSKAIDSYMRAAQIYELQENFIQAFYIYELISFFERQEDCFQKMLELHQRAYPTITFQEAGSHVLKKWCMRKLYKQALQSVFGLSLDMNVRLAWIELILADAQRALAFEEYQKLISLCHSEASCVKTHDVSILYKSLQSMKNLEL